MVQSRKKSTRKSKPVLIKVGRHYISPSDIRCISEVKKGRLYIVKFYSDPNPQYPCWVNPEDIHKVLEHFNIIVGDDEE
jgi:sugar/nucleoside kinase (ribokinase family)